DISNLASPVRLGGYATDGDVFRVQVVGSTAYLAVHESKDRPGFQIVGVGNPASPTYLGGYAPPDPIHGVFVAGTRAYLAAADSGLLILNVADLTTPKLGVSVATLGPALAVEVTGMSAFVMEGEAGVVSYDVANAANIFRTGVLDTRGIASGVRLSGTLAYVADGIGGMAIVIQSVPVNTPPDFPTIPNMAANEGVPWQLLVTATDDETPAGSLVYSLVEGPEGLTVSPFGLIRWTPTEEQGPQFYTVRVAVTDNGSPPESTTNSFQLQVREVNVAPTLPPLDLITILEEQLFTIQLAANDPDLPPNQLFYHLVEGPEGMTVSPTGELAWTPTEVQGPATLLVSVGVVDDGQPPLGSTNFFPIMVLESNKRPVLAAVPPQVVDEGATLSVQLTATDDDRPLNTLTYARVSGPEGLTVSPAGVVTWTPTEAQGPMVTNVLVMVTDNGSPPLSATNQFEVTVREVNRTPVLAAVPTQTVDALVPLSVTLEGSDPDLPVNRLTYSRLAGPDGLTVSESGQVSWTPGPNQAPSTNVVRVRVTDDGTPPLSADREFTVVAWAVEERAIFQIGVDDDPKVVPYVPYGEFSPENDINDPPPGEVTRLPGDPQFDAASNPGADDDYYLRGLYRRGFNQLRELLLVPNDEPFSAWERAVIPSDRTNRLHFRLTASQAVPETWIRVVAEFPIGGSTMRGEVIPGFAEHDLAIRIRNAAGAEAQVFSRRLTAPSTVIAEFPLADVGAVAGPTTLEFIREGPQGPGMAYWLVFDYLRVEIDAGGNEAPLLDAIPDQTVDEGVPWSWTLTGSDPDTPPTPLTYGLVNGPSGLTVSPAGGIAWTPTEAQGPGSYPVSVRVTDNGVPVRSTTNSFTIAVREVNRPPVPAPVSPPQVDELKTLTLPLAATDPDLPPNELTFTLEDGPAGLTVSAAGVVTWTPTEAQGPGVFPVVIQVTDNGVPPLRTPIRFEVTVSEVNTPPRLGAVAPQTVDRLAPLNVTLSSADDDLPANTLTHTLVRGPEGLTVSPSGAVRWVPRPDQAPSTNVVVVRVTDDGTPPLNAEREFAVVALPVEERAIIQVGVDDDPEVLPYNPYAEFRPENGRVDPAPGAVTRVEGDPQFDPASNPAADDAFYVRGIYPAGYNGLSSRLVLPNDEPSTAWETALTSSDPANQLHFRLTEAQAAAGGWMRVVTEFALGGSSTGGQVNPGFADHDVVIRFRNGSGVVTTVSEGRILPPARIITEFSLESVGAVAGPNSIEWVRTGPTAANTRFWLTFDFVRLEVDAGG
ncbi:MAG: hypothetical protein KIT22_12080, partial [Verrucomicrobiae bacterium]|nr:hypothetical protein [Verrucomicrobiae bacterium]